MARTWTFGEKIGAGFALTVSLTLVIGAVAVLALERVVESKDRVIAVHAQNIMDAQRLGIASARRVSAVRGYIIGKQESHLDDLSANREAFLALFARLRGRTVDPEGLRLLAEIERQDVGYRATGDRIIGQRRDDGTLEAAAVGFERDLVPLRNAIDGAIDAFIAHAERRLEEDKQAATALANTAETTLIGLALVIVALAIGCAVFLTRTLVRQIGTAVGQVQSSSAELQAASHQQATSTREQATAMNEITTTITELLATSRQIAESAQRVAQIAEQTAAAARAGEAKVDPASESIAAIRRQMDLIVDHMLDLGRKSQEIGSVLDIVAELAEQTNILAINATIESAGAGEAGLRFAVVADEIRKLADRVAGATKEIRGLIDDVRTSVNTTVMTTEAGSKAVDAGTQQFAEMAATFKRIAGMVGTTTEAAREIELSTKQQATAVEQVNVAVTNVAQATKQTEAASGQSQETAAQLGALSRELLALVRPPDRRRAARHHPEPAA